VREAETPYIEHDNNWIAGKPLFEGMEKDLVSLPIHRFQNFIL
jgi:hypothetical protein